MRPTVNIYVRRPARLLGATLWVAGWLAASLAHLGVAYLVVTIVVAVIQRWAHYRPPVPEEPPEPHVSDEEALRMLWALHRLRMAEQEEGPEQIQARRMP